MKDLMKKERKKEGREGKKSKYVVRMYGYDISIQCGGRVLSFRLSRTIYGNSKGADLRKTANGRFFPST
jgi:hypothetical protein